MVFVKYTHNEFTTPSFITKIEFKEFLECISLEKYLISINNI